MTQSPTKFSPRKALLTAASAAVMTVAMATAAQAQCNPAVPMDGDFVVCQPGTAPITFAVVGDLTVVTGNATTPTNVSTVGTTITVLTTGNNTIHVRNPASTIQSTAGTGIYAYAGGDISIQVDGTITAGATGVYSVNLGGETNINTQGTYGGTGDGIFAYSNGLGGITITSNVASTGRIGIFATDGFSGSSNVIVNAVDTQGYNYDGILAVGGNVVVNSTGTAIGARDGIHAVTALGYGSVNVSANETSGAVNGIYAANYFGGVNVVINSTGSAIGGTTGIRARNDGAGFVTIDANNAYGGTDGIYATNYGTDVRINATGTVTGTLDDGIEVVNYGTGLTRIDAVDVNGVGGDGINVYQSFGGTDLTVNTTGTVNAYYDGIELINLGTGITSVNANNVYATLDDAIYVGTLGNGVDINATGNLVAAGDGVQVLNYGAGTAEVSVYNSAGTYGNGVTTTNIAGSGSTTVNVTGLATGYSGVSVSDYSGSGVYVNSAATNGTALDGVTVYLNAGGNAIINSTAYSNGARAGIAVLGFSAGATATVYAVDTYGGGIDGIAVLTDAGSSVTSTGTAVGNRSGVYTYNSGSGDVVINSYNAIGLNGQGVYAISFGGTESTTINTSGYTAGLNQGIVGANISSGSLTINNSGTAYGATYVGILAYAGGAAQSTVINNTGTAQGGTDGIQMLNFSGRGSTVNSQNAYGGAYGIYVYTATTGTNTIVNTSGVTYGGTDGIYARHRGTGNVIVTTDAGSTTTGGTSEGIDVRASANGGSAAVNANGDVYGATNGISLRNNGSGTTSVNGSGNIDGASQDGIIVVGGTAGTHTRVNVTGNVTGGLDGIDARNAGSGEVRVSANNVYGNGGDGVYAYNSTAGTNASVTTSGTVTGRTSGITLINGGTGATSVAAGAVSATSGAGIYALGVYGTDVSVSATGDVSGYLSGIVARNFGTGETVVSAADVTANGGTGFPDAGIFAVGYGGSTVSVTAGNVTGGYTGTLAGNLSAGDLNVDLASSTGQTGEGVYLYGGFGSADVNLTVSGAISGGTNGVRIIGGHYGDTTVSVGDVTGTAGDGIYAYSYGADVSITSSGTITAGATGVEVQNYGAGTTTINTAETTGGFDGIYAFTFTGDVNITATGPTTGIADDGIEVFGLFNYGSVNITATDVNGYGGDGINVLSFGTDINVSASGTVNSYYDGIELVNLGYGAVTVAAADVNAVFDDGIYIYNTGTDVSVTVTGTVDANTDGIDVYNFGTGSTTISANNTYGAYSYGIFGLNLGTDLSISAAGNTGGYFTGIGGINLGTGATDISANNTSAVLGNAIYAYGSGYGTDVTVTSSGTATGGTSGIVAVNEGTGTTWVSAYNAYGGYGAGIFAAGSGNMVGTDTTVIATGTVIGGTDGIYAANRGTGATTVTAVDVTGLGEEGIDARNSVFGTGTYVSSTGTVTGQTNGISVRNFGSGAATVSAVNVYGMTRDGIIVENDTRGTDVWVEATGTVSGNLDGIDARNEGTGSLTVMAADVQGTNGDGIYATNTSAGTDMSVSASGIVTGDDDGLDVRNYGSGTTSVSAGAQTMGGDDAVYVYSVSDLSLTSTGLVMGGTGEGLDLTSSTGSVTANITGGGVYGGTTGLEATSATGSTVTIASGAAVSGVTTNGWMGAVTDDSITSGGTLTGTASLGDGNDSFVLTGGSVEIVDLGAGTDSFTWSGGSATGQVTGGAGTDTANFNVGGFTFTNSGGAGDLFTAFEILNLNTGGWTLAGTHQGYDEVNFNAGSSALTGTLDSAQVTLNGTGFDLADGSSVTGSLTNNTELTVAGSGVGTSSIGGDFTQSAGGSINFDVFDAVGTNDLLMVGGTSNLAGNININQTIALIPGRVVLIDGAAINGTFDTINGMSSSGLLLVQVLDYENGDVLLSTNINSAQGIAGLSVNQANAGDALIGQLTPSTDPALSAIASAIGTLSSADQLSASLEELHPEVLDASVKTLFGANDRFARDMLAQNRGGSAGVRFALGDSGDNYIWGAFGVSQMDQSDGGTEHIDFESDAIDARVGIVGKSGPVTIGAALGYSDVDAETDGVGTDTSEAEFLQFGAHAGYDLVVGNDGPMLGFDALFSYTQGDVDTERKVIAPAVALAETNTGSFGADSWNARMELSLDGMSGRAWPVQPKLLVGIERATTDSFTETGGATALSVRAETFEREYYGAALEGNFSVTENGIVMLRATGLQYSGDTSTAFNSSYASGDNTSFLTYGLEVDQQLIFEGAYEHNVEGGWVVSVGGFGEFGDLEGYGGQLSLKKNF